MTFFKNLGGQIRKVRKENGGKKSLSKTEQAIFRQLKHLHWPKGSIQSLPAAIRSSTRNYNRFLRAFKKVLEESKKEFPNGEEKKGKHYEFNDLHQFIQQKLGDSFMPVDEYIVCWFEAFNRKIQNWKNWPGVIRPFSFDSKEFELEGLEYTTEWSGNSGAKLWLEFMILIKEELK